MIVNPGEQNINFIDVDTGELHIVRPGSFSDELARQAAETSNTTVDRSTKVVSKTRRVLEYLGLVES